MSSIGKFWASSSWVRFGFRFWPATCVFPVVRTARSACFSASSNSFSCSGVSRTTSVFSLFAHTSLFLPCQLSLQLHILIFQAGYLGNQLCALLHGKAVFQLQFCRDHALLYMKFLLLHDAPLPNFDPFHFTRSITQNLPCCSNFFLILS